MVEEGADRNAHARVPSTTQPSDEIGACRRDPNTRQRVIPNRHSELCTASDCPGCQPCTRTHCVVCGREHVTQNTCPRCLARVRSDLHTIRELYELLPDQALACANADIPGGLAQVLMGPYSEGREALRLALRHGDWSELDVDGIGPEPPLLVLATWEDDWRTTFGHGGGPRATVQTAVDYLQRQLARAAQEHLAFDEFATAIAKTRRQLAAARDDADPTVYGVACFDCGADLRQTFAAPEPCDHRPQIARDAELKARSRLIGPLTQRELRQAITRALDAHSCDQGGRRDTWECTGCHRTYTEHDYRRAVRQAHVDAQPWRRPHEVTAITGVPESTLRRWAARGTISRRTSTERGNWCLYDVAEVRRHAMGGGLLAG